MNRELHEILADIASKARLSRFAVAVEDFESGTRFSHEGRHLFHAASTFKAAVLPVFFVR